VKAPLLTILTLFSLGAIAQKGLEGLYIETYYISSAEDSSDANSGLALPAGSVTYRIYADLAPEWAVQAVFGSPGHPLRLETSTWFFNHIKRGNAEGGDISVNRLGEHTLALDSWITIGTACGTHHGVPKEEDVDGSLLFAGNGEDSQETRSGMLRNAHPAIGRPLTEADGLMPKKPERNLVYGLGLDEFRYEKRSKGIITENGAWSVPAGVSGLTESNRVLLAQLTTTGSVYYAINLQLRSTSGDIEKWVAANPRQGEYFHPSLSGNTENLPGNKPQIPQ
jgi:hypothetical protein